MSYDNSQISCDLTADDRKVLTVNVNHGESSLRSVNPIAIIV